MVIIKYVIAIILFSIIIIFHELGHFWLAKANDIQVNEFSLGLGPTIVGIQRGETKFSLKLLPLGGACMMEGEDSESNNPRAFQKKSVWARISVVAAGPIFNFIMAFVFSIIIIGSAGVTVPIINGVIDGYAAQEAGMQAGDEIIKLNQHRIHFYNEISMYSLMHEGQSVEVTYLRDGQTYNVLLKPTYDSESRRYLYGFSGGGQYEKLGPIRTVEYSVYEVKYWIQYTYGSLRMLVTNQVSVDDMAGPVGIVKTIGDTYESSVQNGIGYAFLNLLNIGILLSANLGVVNLLPLPALDGGRLVFLVIEAIRGKRINPDREGMVHFVGLMCLLALMVFIMGNDIRNIFM